MLQGMRVLPVKDFSSPVVQSFLVVWLTNKEGKEFL